MPDTGNLYELWIENNKGDFEMCSPQPRLSLGDLLYRAFYAKHAHGLAAYILDTGTGAKFHVFLPEMSDA